MNNLTETQYFDDFVLGEKFITATRTITEADIVCFGSLSGDMNLIHMDIEYAKNSLAGQRMAHGLLVLSYAIGLASRCFENQRASKALIAFYGFKEWKFLKPVLIGDTVHLASEVTEIKDTSKPGKSGRGVVTKVYNILNQRDEIVQSGSIMTLYAKRP